MKRVLYFVPEMQVGGGIERCVFEHLTRLSRERFAPALAVCAKRGGFLEHLPDDVPVHVLGRGPMRLLGRAWSLRRLLHRGRFDVIVNNAPYCDIVSGLAGDAARRVSYLHGRLDVVHRVLSNSVTSRLMWRYLQRVYRDGVFIQATPDVTEGVDGIDGARSVVIPYGIDGDHLRERAKEAGPAWPAGSFRLAAAGRLGPQKRYDVMLRAVAHARGKGLDASLVILGEGPDRAALERLVGELGIADHVALPGVTANPYPAIREADLFVHSADWETGPIVILEAFALGTPVLSTRCAGARTLLADDCGRLVPLDAPSAFGDALVELAAAPDERETLTARGLERVDGHEWDPVMGRVEALYDEL